MSDNFTEELNVTVLNSLGIHARPASLFVQTASQFESEIKVVCNDNEVDGKSLMGLLMLAAGKGTELTIKISGNDAKAASEAFYDLVVNRLFDEE